MKIFPPLTTCLALAAAIPAMCALAQSPAQANAHPPVNHEPPDVRIVSPEEGSVFLLDDTVLILADVDHFTKDVAKVEFFADDTSLGVVTKSVKHTETYALTTTNLAAGDYKLTAVATDISGLSVTSAIVDISVVTNLPPAIHFTDPHDGAVILGPTDIPLRATAFDLDGTVASVEFFAGDASLGVVPVAVTFKTNKFGIFAIKQPFALTWSNVPGGTYTLTAVATDNEGGTTVSDPITIKVITDLPPTVRLTSPKGGSTYTAPANINVTANAGDPDGIVVDVQFFANDMLIGESSPPVVNPDLVSKQKKVEAPGNPYTITWNNAPAGTYFITAVAIDNAGSTATSAPVKIKILPPPPPRVIITSPSNHAVFPGGPVNISSFEWNFTTAPVSVEFFADSNLVGTSTNTPISNIVWSDPAPGTYQLRAVATDGASLSVTSAPVTIKIRGKKGTGPMD